MKKIISVLMVLSILLAGYGCKKQDDNESSKKQYTVSYITDTYGKNKDENKQIIKGIESAFGNYKMNLNVVASSSPSVYDSNCSTIIAEGKSDLVIANNYSVSSSLVSALSSFDKTTSKIALIGYEDTTNSGMSILFKNEEPAFLAGVLAAKTTKTNVVGYIGGEDNKYKDYEYGFKSGVKATNPKIKVETIYTNSFSNSTAGQAAAMALKNKKADILFTVCGACSIGVNSYAKDNNMKIIDSTLYTKTSDDIKLASVIDNYKSATIFVSEALIYSSFKKQVYNLGFVDSAVDLKINKNLVSQETINNVNNYKDVLSRYNMNIPKDKNTFDKYNYNKQLKTNK